MSIHRIVRGNWVASACVMLACAAPSIVLANEQTFSDRVVVAAPTEDQRQATLAANVALTGGESAAFWPMYRDYRKEAVALDEETMALLKQFAKQFESLTDAQAKSLIDRWLTIETRRAALKAKYVNEYLEVVPATKVARIMQIENKLDAISDANLAKVIPLAPAS